MSLWRFFLSCALVGASVLVRAEGPEVQVGAPAVKVGDRWKFEWVDRRTGGKEGETVRRVTAVSATQIEGTENSAKLLMTPELNVLESSTSVITGDSRLLSFPLAVGKTWDYKYAYANKLNVNKGRGQVEAKVAAYERIRVKAGEFEAFKIEYRGFWNNDTTGRTGRLKMTTWYSASARCIVQYEYNDGYADSVQQLVEFELQP